MTALSPSMKVALVGSRYQRESEPDNPFIDCDKRTGAALVKRGLAEARTGREYRYGRYGGTSFGAPYHAKSFAYTEFFVTESGRAERESLRAIQLSER